MFTKNERKAGILIPIFSLRTEEGFGVGEFLDLILLADLAREGGFSLIQLLPFFDTSVTKTWKDSYCYSVLSMFALHPIYLRIERAFSEIPDQILEEISVQKNLLNKLEELDYEKVYATKMQFCKRLYVLEGKSFLASASFLQFVQESKEWLLSYAAFSVLRDVFGSSDFSLWPAYQEGTEDVVSQICDPSSEYYDQVCFYYFLQFHLDSQLKEASLYAKERGVFLKGDYPVGVHTHSVETWANPKLFVLQKKIGAPPDYFNSKGQNWGFPAYNKKEARKTSYSWFVRRMRHIERYCQLVRIDHILGYFRFWEIPERYSRGALGFFNPSLSISMAELPENRDRYCKPFITDVILDNCFGERKQWVAESFFEKKEEGQYQFKEAYQNQRCIDLIEQISEEERELLHVLYENVLFIQDLDVEDAFYPKIGLEKTFSFEALDEDQKEFCRGLSQVYYSKEEEELWKKEGLEMLSIFKAETTMDICAEDLGMVPKCVEGVLKELGFLRLHIQRMSKKEEEEFSLPNEYEHLSVCSPSNHDTSTLRGWWEEDQERTQRFYQIILKEEGKVPPELTETLCEKIIQMYLNSDSKWAIVMLQDLLAMSGSMKRKEIDKERINNPETNLFCWQWRIHINLEDLIAEKNFLQFLRGLIIKAGRLSSSF